MSVPLDEGEFGAFFEAVHCYRPYAWQARLLRKVADDRKWPAAVAAPTGAGKTAVLDIALFHLALSAGDKPRPAPLRIVLAVDRRIIVDQAFERAKKLRDKLNSPKPPDDIVRRVADRLSALSGPRSLHVAQLRGGMPLERDWAKRPDQPTILCTTVDQLGSRLLFRGYGVSTSMAPVHAGLLGNDTLVILDEAHLSHAFTKTLKAISAERERGDALELPWGWSALTATPRPREDGDAFKLLPDEREEPRIERRLAAKKPVEIVKPETSKPEDFVEKLAGKAETMAKNLRSQGIEAPTVAVVVNRVALARMVFNDLREKRRREGDPDTPEQLILLTGRVRPVERDELIEKHRARLEDRCKGANAPLFVVATQCIEAGADFDFDGIVSQIAPLDALRQRFGRLARSGNRGDTPAPGVVVAMKGDVGKKSDDPVYGTALHHSWAWLEANAEGDRKKKVVDFGPDALDAILECAPPDSKCFAPAPSAPLLRNADLEAFSMTSPRPFPDPDPALFLHGEFRTDNDVSLVWRADIPKDGPDPKVIAEVLTLVPPRTEEALRLPLWVARRWLSARLSERPVGDDDPDHPLVDVPMREREAGGAAQGEVYRWRGVKESGMEPLDKLRPGDVIVLPAELGGCDRFGWSPDSVEPVDDIAAAAASAYAGRKAALRLHPKTMRRDHRWEEIAPLLENESAPKTVLEALLEIDDWPEIDGWRKAKGPLRLLRPYPYPYENAAILVAPRGLGDGAPEESAEPATEDDLGSFGGEALSLSEHAEAVRQKARKFAQRLQLAPTLAAPLERAAEWHDSGKDDPRFQAFLRCCGDLDASKGPYAKSGAPNAPAGARNRAGLPDRWRHEVASVRYAAARLGTAPSGEGGEALLLWLIGTHHGHGRPFFGHKDDWDEHVVELCGQRIPAAPGPDKLDFDWRGRDWCRLWAQLQERYGYWGLAYLEACLRLADHRASEEGGG